MSINIYENYLPRAYTLLILFKLWIKLCLDLELSEFLWLLDSRLSPTPVSRFDSVRLDIPTTVQIQRFRMHFLSTVMYLCFIYTCKDCDVEKKKKIEKVYLQSSRLLRSKESRTREIYVHPQFRGHEQVHHCYRYSSPNAQMQLLWLRQ